MWVVTALIETLIGTEAQVPRVSRRLYLVLLYISVLVRLAIALMKHQGQNQVGEGSVYLTYISILLLIIEGSQEGNSNRAGAGGRN